MSGVYTEADYESKIIELFKNMGWRHVYGPDLDRDYKDPLSEEELEDVIRRINPDMPESAIHEALFKLKNFDNANLVESMKQSLYSAAGTIITIQSFSR